MDVLKSEGTFSKDKKHMSYVVCLEKILQLKKRNLGHTNLYTISCTLVSFTFLTD